MTAQYGEIKMVLEVSRKDITSRNWRSPKIKKPVSMSFCQTNPLITINKGRGRFVIRELLWSFLFLLLPVELRGLVGVTRGMGQGRVLLPWLLKPEVAVEQGEKPPLTRAKRRHSATHIKRPAQLERSTSSMTFNLCWQLHALLGACSQRKETWLRVLQQSSWKWFYKSTNEKKSPLLWCLASSDAVISDNLHLQWSCWLCGWLGLLHVLLWLACGGWQ